MKKIVLILCLCFVFIVFVNAKIKDAYVEEIDLNIERGQMGILFYQIDEYRYMVVCNDKEAKLVLIDNKNNIKNKEILKKLGILKYNVQNLENFSSFDDIIVRQEKNIFQISNKNVLFCISEGALIPSKCEYVYLLKESSFDDMKLVFYHDNFSRKYEELLYEKWVDSYKLNKENIIFVKFYDNTYSVINISNRIIDLR